MKYLIRPLTKRMFTHLQHGRSIELSQSERNICGIDDYKGSLPGLYRRGLVDVKRVAVNGKEVVVVFITKSGINFLNHCLEDAPYPGNR